MAVRLRVLPDHHSIARQRLPRPVQHGRGRAEEGKGLRRTVGPKGMLAGQNIKKSVAREKNKYTNQIRFSPVFSKMLSFFSEKQ